MTQDSYKGTALVTGASSGIGAIYAHRLTRRGYDLVVVARDSDRLAQLARRLKTETGQRVTVLAANLNEKADLAQVEAVLIADERTTMLVNSAGVAATASLLDADVDQMEEMITLNVMALTRLIYAAAPGFVARGAGTIINIASIVALHPEILNGVYGRTKACVLALTLSLQKELAGRNVRVQAVLPGATATDFWIKAGLPIEKLPGEIVMPADEMVDAALSGLDQGELVTIPALPDRGDWDSCEAARQTLIPNLSRRSPAVRYRVVPRK